LLAATERDDAVRSVVALARAEQGEEAAKGASARSRAASLPEAVEKGAKCDVRSQKRPSEHIVMCSPSPKNRKNRTERNLLVIELQASKTGYSGDKIRDFVAGTVGEILGSYMTVHPIMVNLGTGWKGLPDEAALSAEAIAASDRTNLAATAARTIVWRPFEDMNHVLEAFSLFEHHGPHKASQKL